MITSKDPGVQEFLTKLEASDLEKFAIVKSLREVVFAVCPQVSERIMYGGIMFTAKEDFGGIFVSQKHVSFEFSRGVDFNDLSNHLEGTGKLRRHLKIMTLSDIEEKEVEKFVTQAVQ